MVCSGALLVLQSESEKQGEQTVRVSYCHRRASVTFMLAQFSYAATFYMGRHQLVRAHAAGWPPDMSAVAGWPGSGRNGYTYLAVSACPTGRPMTTDWDSRLLTFVAILPVTAHPSPVHLPHSLTFIFFLFLLLYLLDGACLLQSMLIWSVLAASWFEQIIAIRSMLCQQVYFYGSDVLQLYTFNVQSLFILISPTILKAWSRPPLFVLVNFIFFPFLICSWLKKE
jgi:hypothetical protein